MKTYSTLTVFGVAVVAASGLWGLHSSWGQEAAATNAAQKPSPKVTVKLKLRGGPHSMQTIREAAAAISEAEDDEAREQAEQELGELLDEYFEEDMKRREQELAEVEARVKKLRELMERRREKKQEIIELQVEVLRNEADGLGFFSGEGPGGPMKSVLHLDPLSFPVPPTTAPRAALPAGHPFNPYERATAAPAPAAPPTTGQIPR